MQQHAAAGLCTSPSTTWRHCTAFRVSETSCAKSFPSFSNPSPHCRRAKAATRICRPSCWDILSTKACRNGRAHTFIKHRGRKVRVQQPSERATHSRDDCFGIRLAALSICATDHPALLVSGAVSKDHEQATRLCAETHDSLQARHTAQPAAASEQQHPTLTVWLSSCTYFCSSKQVSS